MTRKIRLFLTPVLLFTLALTLCRVYLYIKYREIFDAPMYEIFLSFVRGVRFDISTSFIVSLPFMLALFIPFGNRSGRLAKLFLYLLAFWQIFLLGYNFGDIHFFAHSQKHLTYEISYYISDLGSIYKMGYQSFLLPIAGFLAILFLYGIVYIKAISKSARLCYADEPFPGALMAIQYVMTLLICSALSVVAIRGGLQPRPIVVDNAFAGENEALGNLALNGIYTTAQAIADFLDSKGRLNRELVTDFNAFSDVSDKMVDKEKEIFNPAYPLYRRFNYPSSARKEMNVVVFIMEGWSAKHIGALNGDVDTTPNFDKLAGDGLLLTNCFANSQRTMEGVLAVTGSFPTWNPLIMGFSGLVYQTRLRPIGSVFKRLGYETIFIHGTRKFSKNFNLLSKRMGFSRHISMEDFEPEELKYDGAWGVYDEPVFMKAHRTYAKLSKEGKPFFSVIMSITSHLPFRLPSDKFDKFTKEKSPLRDFYNAMGYSDYALGKFFDAARKSDYYDNTLFVIVADHVAGYFAKKSLYESYRIPCLYLSDKLGLKGTYEKSSNHFDITPTVLDLLRVNRPFTSWGKSIFSGGKRVTMLPRGVGRVYVDGSYMLHTEAGVAVGLYDYTQNPEQNILKNDKSRTEELSRQMRRYTVFGESLIFQNAVRAPAR